MKRNAVRFAFAGTLLLAVVAWNLAASSPEQRQEFSIRSVYRLGEVALNPGNYVVIHSAQKKSEGLECTLIYKAPYYRGKEPVAKAHCVLLQGAPVQGFTIESTRQADGSQLIHSIQFAGSTEVHNLGMGG